MWVESFKVELLIFFLRAVVKSAHRASIGREVSS